MESAEEKLDKIGAYVREALAAETTQAEDIRVTRASFLQQVATRNVQVSRRTRGPVPWWILFLAGAAVAGALVFWLRVRVPISFEIGGTGMPGRMGDLVESRGKEPLAVRFSEGSSLFLHQGGRLRVLSSDARGARVLVEDGFVDAAITHVRRDKPHWNFEVGPFHVLVTGTRFQLDFHSEDQSLSLVTQEGQVLVSGACLSTPRAVSAGERLDLSCLLQEGRAALLQEERAAHAASAPGSSPAMLEESAAPLGSDRGARSTPRWRELLAAGRLADGLQAVERADFNRVCQVATAKELLALADAARLYGRATRAMTALRVLRQRFPASPDAATAAFTLGRIAFERQHAYAEAADWFATCLREQPDGPLMGDSFGRLMEARARAGDQARARMDAQQYLRRFPEGPYASEARGILSK
jgi:TolA-binding protein